jgi:hypothetical protein
VTTTVVGEGAARQSLYKLGCPSHTMLFLDVLIWKMVTRGVATQAALGEVVKIPE